jgi:hypothetical protein
MKKKLLLITAIILLAGNYLSAQQLDVKWTSQQIYKNSEDGFFSYYIGKNKQNIYAKYTNAGKSTNNIKLIAYDVETMKRKSEVTLMDRKAPNKKYKGMRHYKSMVFDNIIYIFWAKDEKNKLELYVESFDENLKRNNPLLKVYEVNYEKSKAKKGGLLLMGS